MRYRIVKIAAVLTILVHLASCASGKRGDNRRPDHHHYRRAGRAW